MSTPTAAPAATHLDKLEAQSIYIMREAFAKFENMAMLWSIGKDSCIKHGSMHHRQCTGRQWRCCLRGNNGIQCKLVPFGSECFFGHEVIIL